MKKLTIILILLFSVHSFSQDSERHNRIKTLKIAFITERLELSSTEAEKFWPIYNAYETQKSIYRSKRQEKRDKISSDITESEAQRLLQDMIQFEKEKENLKTGYIQNLLKVLPAKKVIQLKMAEEAFNKQMLKQYHKRKEQR